MFNNHMAYHLKTNCDFPSAFADTVASKCIRAVICINTRQIITTKLNEVLQVASQAGEVRVIVGLKVFQEEELSRASELGAGSPDNLPYIHLLTGPEERSLHVSHLNSERVPEWCISITWRSLLSLWQ